MRLDALGQKLAADFRDALARSAPGIQVEDRTKLIEILQQRLTIIGKTGLSASVEHCRALRAWLLQRTWRGVFSHRQRCRDGKRTA